ncbi:MerR family transcriptional regulator [Staphylococcus argenteus]|uniref:MerR family transcriptional regulator n=1 Tax=Staphylococcus argenteus TaxID=985002 RepID=UPI001FC82AC7|nr:MerR family transcriptional regulator [Staphylococcus argenteus]GJG19802.1 MerR family transcriptional regulator [Staphylococcus argenteus]
MKTKEVVALMNISQDTLRYYEKVGVVPPVNRDENGYRIYTDSDLNWIYLVKNLRNAGVSIESLIEFYRLAQLPKNENIQAQQKQILNKQLEELNENLKTIHDARDLLQYKIDNYDNHIAKINASDNQETNVERLWERK